MDNMNNEDVVSSEYNVVELRTIKKVGYHIVTFAFLLYFFNVVDRLNLGYAALQMNVDLNITAMDFGVVSSIFFISYLLFQVPSNMILQRSKANRWIGFILCSWGITTFCMFFVNNITQLLVCRFVLGVFEAGFFPGMMFYFARWFPKRELGKVTSFFMLAGATSSFIASPVSGWIIQHVHWLGYAGWRWLFVVEGIPTALLGIVTILFLINSPEHASWLSRDEKTWLTRKIKSEYQEDVTNTKWYQAFFDKGLWQLACIYMFIQGAAQAATFWLPSIVKSFSTTFSDTEVGLVMALPFICATICMPIWGAHSDKCNERKLHTGIPMLIFAVAYLGMTFCESISLKILFLALYGIGTYCFYGPFWALPNLLLKPSNLAISIAVINSCSSLGGFVTNYVNGVLAKYYGTTGILLFSVGLCICSFLLVVSLRINKKESTQQILA